ERSLIQTIGRAARNENGHVIMYADNITGSMEKAIAETNRRRKIQSEYNEKHGLIPQTIIKEIRDVIEIGAKEKTALSKHSNGEKKLSKLERDRMIEQLSAEMKAAAAKLEFEQAAFIRDRIKELRNQK
ncbi:MAG: excinuclease ABC subunit B, partial [Ruminococcaceae bacterium]|nr:excinuclease ABC subunit B [Oscillospiraceae bacterium]